MLSFSLRAVLRNESWIFCAGLFSICRSPCKFWTFNKLLPQPVARTVAETRGDKPVSIRPFHCVSPPAEALGQHSVPYGVRPDFSTFWTRKFCKSPEISYRQLGDMGNLRDTITCISNRANLVRLRTKTHTLETA